MSENHTNRRMIRSFIDRKSKGFTLVELLVCISIIALLIATLLPALSTAVSVSRTTRCLSTERSYAVPFTSYVADYKEAYPYAHQAQTPLAHGSYTVFGSSGTTWVKNLGIYFSTENTSNVNGSALTPALRCAENPWKNIAGFGRWGGTTYGLNSLINGNGNTAPFPYSYGPGLGAPADSQDPYLIPSKFINPRKTTGILRPSQTMIMAEVTNATTAELPVASNWAPIVVNGDWFDSASPNPSTGQAYWVTDEFAGGGFGRMNHYMGNGNGWNSLQCDMSAKYYSQAMLFEWGKSTNTTIYQGTINIPKSNRESSYYWYNK